MNPKRRNSIPEVAGNLQTAEQQKDSTSCEYRDSPTTLLEKVKEKKRMYMQKVRELDNLENELTDSNLEARLKALEEHYSYI